MELYTFFNSSAAYRVRIALQLKGIAPSHQHVDLTKGEHLLPWYREITPLGLVPALVEDGRVLSQSLAIVEYIDERHPAPPLLPDDPFVRALARAAALTVCCEIHPLQNMRVRKRLSALGLDDAAVETWRRDWITEGLEALEAQVVHDGHVGDYLYGERPSLADICMVPQLYNARRFGCDLSGCPTLVAVDGRCLRDAAFAAAAPDQQPDAR